MGDVMPRKRAIEATEAPLWLGVLLDHAFGENVSQAVSRAARLDLLAIAHDVTAYPDDIPPVRASVLMLEFSEQWLDADDWQRLQARLRQRRRRA
jgi:hypothetical protein